MSVFERERVCVCERERERERQRQGDRERAREMIAVFCHGRLLSRLCPWRFFLRLERGGERGRMGKGRKVEFNDEISDITIFLWPRLCP